MEPKKNTSSPIFCEHANEVPVCCPCNSDCYCKQHTCSGRPSLLSDLPIVDDPNEMYEEAIMAIIQMREWLSCIYSPSKLDRAFKVEYVDIRPSSRILKLFLKAKIWTLNNVYSITSSIHTLNPPGYLGCAARSRKPRTGETWCRGNDLADGDFGEKTWYRILQDIVRYEAEEVKSEKWKETNVVA